MAYFDNAATTYPKPDEVYSFMSDFYRQCGGNVGRGEYGIAKSAGELVRYKKQVADTFALSRKTGDFYADCYDSLEYYFAGAMQDGRKKYLC